MMGARKLPLFRCILLAINLSTLIAAVVAYGCSYLSVSPCPQCGEHAQNVGWHMHCEVSDLELFVFWRSGWAGLYSPMAIDPEKPAVAPRLQIPGVISISHVPVASKVAICTVNANLLVVLLIMAIWPFFLAIVSAVGFFKRRRRYRFNLCLNCGYDLRGSPAKVCAECGDPCDRSSSTTPNSL